MTVAEIIARISDRNYEYFKAQASERKETEEKCYDCKQFPYYGKTCRGVCTKK